MHILIPLSGDFESDVRLALTCGANLCASRGVSQLDIIVPHKNYLPSIDVGKALGSVIAERLAKRGTAQVKIGDREIVLRVQEPETAVASKDIRVAVVFYLALSNMERLVAVNIDVTIYVPYGADEGDAWAKRWTAMPPPESEGKQIDADFSDIADTETEEPTAWEIVSTRPIEDYPDALEELHGKKPAPDWIEAFRSAWHFSDSILVNEAKWRKLLPMAGGLLTAERERLRLEAMPEKITVYRGCAEASSEGLSWTVSDYWAHFFPKDRRGVIVKGEVEKRHVIGFLCINDEEEELIILPENVTNKEILERWMP